MDDEGDNVTDLAGLRAAVLRLAKLDREAYELARRKVAEDFQIRVTSLDRLVAKARDEGAPADELPGAAVVFPQDAPWPEEVELAEVIDDYEKVLQAVMVMNAHQRLAVMLWSAFAHGLGCGCFDHSPRLAIESSVKRSGKSRLLGLLRHAVPKALAAASVSASGVFRIVDASKPPPTLLLDEGDNFVTAENADLKAILNAGYDKDSAVALRVEGERVRQVRAFSIWCAMAIALIGRLPGTLEDRAIAIVLERRLRNEKIERLTKAHYATLRDIRRRLARWAATHKASLQEADPQIPGSLNDRAATSWAPLLAIAEATGPALAAQARAAAVALAAAHEAATQEFELEALVDIRCWLEEERNQGRDNVWTSELVTCLLSCDPERPWREYGRRRKEITQAQLARLLSRIGLVSTVQWQGRAPNQTSARGYTRGQLLEAIHRYLPPVQSVKASEPAP
jgi:putative DNA primase/helicase